MLGEGEKAPRVGHSSTTSRRKHQHKRSKRGGGSKKKGAKGTGAREDVKYCNASQLIKVPPYRRQTD